MLASPILKLGSNVKEAHHILVNEKSAYLFVLRVQLSDDH